MYSHVTHTFIIYSKRLFCAARSRPCGRLVRLCSDLRKDQFNIATKEKKWRVNIQRPASSEYDKHSAGIYSNKVLYAEAIITWLRVHWHAHAYLEDAVEEVLSDSRAPGHLD